MRLLSYKIDARIFKGNYLVLNILASLQDPAKPKEKL